MLNRSIAPAFGKIVDIPLIQPKVVHLDNGIPVFSLDVGIQNVLKVELCFQAGSATADRMLVANAAAKLITEGTSTKTAAQIAESVDFYGAYLQTNVDQDETGLDLFTLNKHLDKTLGTLAEVYQDPIYPEKELQTYILNGQQELMVSQQKVGYLASKGFSAALFGKDHPYGRSAGVEDYNTIAQADLSAFYNARIKGNIRHILVAGRMGKDTFSLLNKHFGSTERDLKPPIPIDVGENIGDGSILVEKADAVQNAIRIGRLLFDRKHPDYVGMQILSTVLGGYFGSRLMSNIREDKGYTYGIGAGLVSLKNTGYLSISTEVGADVSNAAKSEIYFEIERLRKDLIPQQELELVRNYMLGTVLKSVDGAFALSSKWKNYLKHDMGIEEHERLIRQIKNITAERLLQLADQYLQKDDLIEVIAGKPSSN